MPKKAGGHAKLRYEDRPDIGETFADSVHGLFVNGQLVNVEFTVTRMDERGPDGPPTGRRVPACRLVLPAAAAVDLANKLNQLIAALNKPAKARNEAPVPALTTQ